jgi:ribonuclease HI
MFNVYQLNLQHCKSATIEFLRNFNNNNIHVALLQEPYVRDKKLNGLKDSNNIILCDDSNDRPRACILINNKIQFICLNNFSDGDLFAIKIKINDGTELVLASVYMPYCNEVMPPQKLLANLVSYCKIKNLQLIIGCDSNSHHTVWASSNTNKRGEHLLDFVTSNDLIVLNEGAEPTYVNSVRSEIIDLTLCTQFIGTKVTNWHVSDKITLSDHRLIYFNIDTILRFEVYYRNPKKTNWQSYCVYLNENLECLNNRSILSNANDLDLYASNFNAALINAYEKSNALRKRAGNRKCLWYSEHLAELRKKVRRLWNASKKQIKKGLFEHQVVIAYRYHLANYNKAIKQAKTKSWQSKCNEIDKCNETARMMKFLSGNAHKNVNSLKKSDGTFTESIDESIELLLNTHFPNCIKIDNNNNNNQNTNSFLDNTNPVNNNYTNINYINYSNTVASISNTIDKNVLHDIDQIVTISKIKWAIASFSPFKSAGGDGIFPALLQQGENIIHSHLVLLFKASLTLSYIPTAWCSTRVVFLPKIGKSTYTEAKSFRPISLSSFILKTLEKLIDLHIKCFLRVDERIHPLQFAYRAGYSTVNAIHSITSKIEKTLHEKELALVGVLDIEAAFNDTTYDAVSKGLQSVNVNKFLIDWILNMLNKRIITVTLNDSTVKVRPTQGTPQGGCLSTLLWSLVVNDLLYELNNTGGIHAVGFADDFCLYVSGKYLSTVKDVFQRGLNIVEAWCNNKNLSVNANKTNIMCVSRKYKLILNDKLKIFGNEINYVENLKYLGVLLDKKLNWNDHLQFVYNKSIRALWTCRAFVGKTWGINPHIMNWVYKQVVIPKITYAAVVWAHRSDLGAFSSKLCQIQRTALLCITGAMKSTPTASLEAFLSLPPLSLVLNEVAKITAIRFKMNKTWCIEYQNYGHGQLNKFLNDNRSFWNDVDQTTRTYSFNNTFRTLIGTGDLSETNLSETDLDFYTDAAKNPKGVGVGISSDCFDNGLKFKLDEHCTVLQAEIFGIYQTASFCLDEQSTNMTINIFSDSKCAINAIAKCEHYSSLTLRCVDALNALAANNRVNVIWVRAHAGWVGNENADRLAKEAINLTSSTSIPISLSSVKSQLREKTLLIHNRSWSSTSGYNTTKSFLPIISANLTNSLLSLKRHNLKILVELLTGHCLLKSHRWKMKLCNDKLCRLCMEEDEDSIHVICNCNALKSLRKKYFNVEFLDSNKVLDFSLTTLLKFIKECDIVNLLSI